MKGEKMGEDNSTIRDWRKGFSLSIEVKIDDESLKDLDALFFLKRLESLVPPSELCIKIPQDDFFGSALAWYMKQNDPSNRMVMPRYSDVPGWVLFAPAPTLQEILMVLPCGILGNFYLAPTDKGTYMIDVVTNGVATEIADGDTPATAALRLWFEVTKRGDSE